MKLLNQKGNAVLYATIIIVTILIVVGGIWILGSSNNSSPTGTTADLPSPIGEDDWQKGDGTVTLVEYSDFQCPACGSFFPVLKQISEQYSDSLTFVYRHFPLTSIHSNAVPAAYATEAAGEQGAFWEMHDMLFENQSSWSSSSNPEEDFVFYAEQLNLDIQQFQQDYSSSEVRKRVQQDRQEAVNAGLSSTPTFFLNGEQVTNIQSFEQFAGMIESAIEESNQETGGE